MEAALQGCPVPRLHLLGPDHAVGRLRDQLSGCRALPVDMQLLTDDAHAPAPLRLELTGVGWQLAWRGGELIGDAFPDDVLDLEASARLRYVMSGLESLPESWRGRLQEGTPAEQAAMRRALRWGLSSLCETILAALWELPRREAAPEAVLSEPVDPFDYPFASAAAEVFEQVHGALGHNAGTEPRPLLELMCTALREQASAAIVAAWLAHQERCSRAQRRAEPGPGIDVVRAGARTLAGRAHARLLPRSTALPERGAGWRPQDDASFQELLETCLRPRLVEAGKTALDGLREL